MSFHDSLNRACQNVEDLLHAAEGLTSLDPDLVALQKSLLRFLFTFNMFEACLFVAGDRTPTHEVCNLLCSDLVHKTDWFNSSLTDYSRCWQFFKKRFFEQSNPDHRQNIRLFYRVYNGASQITNNQETIESCLRHTEDGDGKDVARFSSCLSLAYQYRNNLYHGVKSLIGLIRYRECFDEISIFLNKLLSDMARHKFEGLLHKYPRQ